MMFRKNKLLEAKLEGVPVGGAGGALETLLVIPGFACGKFQDFVGKLGDAFKVFVLGGELPRVEQVAEFADLVSQKLLEMRVKTVSPGLKPKPVCCPPTTFSPT